MQTLSQTLSQLQTTQTEQYTKVEPTVVIDENPICYRLTDDIIRYYPSNETDFENAKKFEQPSFAFEGRLGNGEVITDGTLKPRFFRSELSTIRDETIITVVKRFKTDDFNNANDPVEVQRGVFGVVIDVEQGTSFYGGGEQASSLCLNGRDFITWNLDAYRYMDRDTNLYQSHPYVLGLRPDGSAFGVVVDSTFPLLFHMENNRLVIESKLVKSIPFSVIIINADSPQKIVSRLAELTGKIELPPKWSIGYHQCRWSYYPEDQAREVAKQFRDRSIPCDVIWFDIHYMNQYRIFTFDPVTFPNPKKLNEDLHAQGYHTVWMIDPGIMKDENYSVYNEAVENDICILKEDKKEIYVGKVWPGDCVFPDFTMEKAREWWGGLYKDFMGLGIDGVWNDMNEPAVFDTETGTMPNSNYHRGCGGGTHFRFHNVFGMNMVKASKEGIKKANPDLRPFILSRSNFLGGQRYAATWTGDNVSDWHHLHLSIPMILNLGLSAQPFSGPDIGGFFDEATPELWARWIGFGALLPFSRGHTATDTVPHEPYAFGQQTEDVARIALGWRYKLLPYYYTLFRRASLTGLPVMSPLFFVDPKDRNLRNEDRAFMIGDWLLVIVDVKPEGHPLGQPVSLPTNALWYDLQLDDVKQEHRDLPTLKIRGGGIIPTRPVQQYVNEKSLTEFSLHIALDENHKATGQFYEDAGDGYGYKKGEYQLISYNASLVDNVFTLDIEKEGSYFIPDVPITIHLYYEGMKKSSHVISSNDAHVEISM